MMMMMMMTQYLLFLKHEAASLQLLACYYEISLSLCACNRLTGCVRCNVSLHVNDFSPTVSQCHAALLS